MDTAANPGLPNVQLDSQLISSYSTSEDALWLSHTLRLLTQREEHTSFLYHAVSRRGSELELLPVKVFRIGFHDKPGDFITCGCCICDLLALCSELAWNLESPGVLPMCVIIQSRLYTLLYFIEYIVAALVRWWVNGSKKYRSGALGSLSGTRGASKISGAVSHRFPAIITPIPSRVARRRPR